MGEAKTKSIGFRSEESVDSLLGKIKDLENRYKPTTLYTLVHPLKTVFRKDIRKDTKPSKELIEELIKSFESLEKTSDGPLRYVNERDPGRIEELYSVKLEDYGIKQRTYAEPPMLENLVPIPVYILATPLTEENIKACSKLVEAVIDKLKKELEK